MSSVLTRVVVAVTSYSSINNLFLFYIWFWFLALVCFYPRSVCIIQSWVLCLVNCYPWDQLHFMLRQIYIKCCYMHIIYSPHHPFCMKIYTYNTYYGVVELFCSLASISTMNINYDDIILSKWHNKGKRRCHGELWHDRASVPNKRAS